MKFWWHSTVFVLSITVPLIAASRPHVVAFGSWTTVKWLVGPEQKDAVALKIRGLYVDGQLKEFTTRPAHEITQQLLAVQSAMRINDALPQETGSSHWQWVRGGWLLVNRENGHISSLKLPDFDNYYSAGSWYRDYFAYCGISTSENKRFAIVAQPGAKKPLLKQALGPAPKDGLPDSGCALPVWERQPARVTFSLGDDKQGTTFVIHDQAAAVSAEEHAEE
jgi:hypothetical protein